MTQLEKQLFEQYGKYAGNSYASHLPVLYWLFSVLKIKTVFEFGCGNYSTPVFVKNCESVESIEMQEQVWFDKIKDQFKENKNLSLKCMLGPDLAIEYFKNLDTLFDLVFVDGHGHSRWKAINAAFLKTTLVIAHDTQEPGYKWENVKLPDNWKRIDITCFNDTWTTIFFNTSINISKLLQ